MSTLPISIDTLAQVRETIYMSFFWRKSGENVCLGLFDAFSGQSHYASTEDEAFKAAEKFVNEAYRFNSIACIAYFNGLHYNSNKEPEAWDCDIQAMHNMRRKRLTLVQLYKTIQCIDYNTDVKGYFTPQQYQAWDRRLEYEAFMHQLQRMERRLAAHIISELDEYKAAAWG